MIYRNFILIAFVLLSQISYVFAEESNLVRIVCTEVDTFGGEQGRILVLDQTSNDARNLVTQAAVKLNGEDLINEDYKYNDSPVAPAKVTIIKAMIGSIKNRPSISAVNSIISSNQSAKVEAGDVSRFREDYTFFHKMDSNKKKVFTFDRDDRNKVNANYVMEINGQSQSAGAMSLHCFEPYLIPNQVEANAYDQDWDTADYDGGYVEGGA